jgi:MFS family permease
VTVVDFTPVSALAGGAMIGLAAAGLWWLLGRLAGVSNILGTAITARSEDSGWRFAFLAGLLAAGLLAILAFPQRSWPACWSVSAPSLAAAAPAATACAACRACRCVRSSPPSLS